MSYYVAPVVARDVLCLCFQCLKFIYPVHSTYMVLNMSVPPVQKNLREGATPEEGTPELKSGEGGRMRIGIVKVERPMYSLLRSFIESSEKPEYYHNIPFAVSENHVEFRKPNKWILHLWREGDKIVGELERGRLRVGYEKTAVEEKVVIDDTTITVQLHEVWVDSKTYDNFAILPVIDKYGEPAIYIFDITSKFRHYINIMNSIEFEELKKEEKKEEGEKGGRCP